MRSLAPILSCLMLVWVPCLMAGSQNQNKYLHENLWCDLCPPGQFVEKDCTPEKKTACQPCPPDTYSELLDSRTSCKKCTTCQKVLSKCTPSRDTNCSCNDGFLCTSTKCNECQEKEECGRGHELSKIGEFQYSFQCVPCQDNMYSDTEGGTCKPFTRCAELGMETLSPGNKTHNSRCSVGLPSVNVCPSITMDLPDKTPSFQLSKEEKGDGPVQEKHAKSSLTSLTEDIVGTLMTGGIVTRDCVGFGVPLLSLGRLLCTEACLLKQPPGFSFRGYDAHRMCHRQLGLQ
ncbi:hypothetical protein AAFF_G00385030 [Aldrovandia affinis]|uniref:TNFR-Cys domain-containing protein n=1 Tax=Aldrovandia affinis TaxID=143900 RepID=A0AAD7SFB1_9TELE|nr:hypothetical protein AAFF_G00385030 [Aldrovandia affinis]